MAQSNENHIPYLMSYKVIPRWFKGEGLSICFQICQNILYKKDIETIKSQLILAFFSVYHLPVYEPVEIMK